MIIAVLNYVTGLVRIEEVNTDALKNAHDGEIERYISEYMLEPLDDCAWMEVKSIALNI